MNLEQRKALNDKVLYLIDSKGAEGVGITKEDIFNAYTGDGGLHGLQYKDFDDYHSYSEQKKEIENGQFFTPPPLCEFVTACLKLSDTDLVADLTCGMGHFFNYLPVESNAYSCEIDIKAYKVAHHLYPDTNLELGDLRTYQPQVRFDYVLGNPPYNLKWSTEPNGEMLSQLYYCKKAAELLKPLGILALIVPQSFLTDDFTDGAMIKAMEARFSFLGQVGLPDDAFSAMGVSSFPTKLQFWQKRTDLEDWKPRRYVKELSHTLANLDAAVQAAPRYYQEFLMVPKTDLEQNKSRVLLELAKERDTSKDFLYQCKSCSIKSNATPPPVQSTPSALNTSTGFTRRRSRTL